MSAAVGGGDVPPVRRLCHLEETRLAPGGHAVLVVQKHLGSDSLHRWLAGEGWAVTRRTSRIGYRVLDVQREPPAADGGSR